MCVRDVHGPCVQIPRRTSLKCFCLRIAAHCFVQASARVAQHGGCGEVLNHTVCWGGSTFYSNKYWAKTMGTTRCELHVHSVDTTGTRTWSHTPTMNYDRLSPFRPWRLANKRRNPLFTAEPIPPMMVSEYTVVKLAVEEKREAQVKKKKKPHTAPARHTKNSGGAHTATQLLRTLGGVTIQDARFTLGDLGLDVALAVQRELNIRQHVAKLHNRFARGPFRGGFSGRIVHCAGLLGVLVASTHDVVLQAAVLSQKGWRGRHKTHTATVHKQHMRQVYSTPYKSKKESAAREHRPKSHRCG